MTGLFDGDPVTVIGPEDDPLAGLVMAALGPGAVLRPTPTGRGVALYLSAQTWLAHLDVATDAHVILRLRRPNGSDAAWRWSLSLVVAALARGARARFWAVSEPVAQEVAALIGAECAVLPTPPGAPGLIEARLDEAAGLVRFDTDAGETTRPLDGLNLARLRLRARLIPPVAGVSPDLAALVRHAAARGSADSPAIAAPRSLVFVVSNGVGLGHLTRMLAIARELRDSAGARILFWSYSRAASLIAAQGFAVVTRHTSEHLGESERRWRRREAAELSAALHQWQPAGVVLDGSALIRPVAQALNAPGCERIALVWLRRGMWQRGADPGPIELGHFCDLILEPGDLAEAADTGPTATHRPRHRGLTRIVRTAPVVATAPAALMPRRAARRALGHRSWKPLCLVSLGGDALSDNGLLTGLVARAAQTGAMRFLWLRSPFASGDTADLAGIRSLSAYPVAPMLNGVDAVISTAGYNSFHELMLLSEVPVLFAPALNARLDDQKARAQFAASQGWARHLDLEAERSPAAQLAEFLAHLGTAPRRPSGVSPEHGVRQMAAEILRATGLNASEGAP